VALFPLFSRALRIRGERGVLMGSRTATWLAWSMCLVAAAALAGTLAIDAVASSLDAFTILGVPPILAFSVVGALIASRRQDNPIGWLLCGVGLSFALGSLAGEYAPYALITEPGSLPSGDIMAWLGTWIWPPGIILVFTYLLLLFPDGRLPSRRWKPVAWLAGVALLITVIPVAVAAWPIRGPILANIGEEAPAGSSAAFKVAYDVQVSGILLLFVLGIASAASLVIRLRRATGDERAQLKWFAYAGAFAVVAFIANSPLFHVGGDVLPGVALMMVPAAVGIAMFKYRLYDIDVVINKTVVVAVLAAFVTAVYLAIVVGIGAAIGSTGQPNVLLSIAATAIVALAFQPLRERARRLADRVVYGKRASPYEVLSDFSERMAGSYSTEDVLPRMARILGEGTGATRTEVWLRVGDQLRPAALWPEGTEGAESEKAPLPVPEDELPEFPDSDRAVAVRHQSELLGALTLTKPPSEPVAPAEEKLLSDLASQAGLMLRNVRLTAELQARLVDLRASRQRLVAAQDQERRRLERDLHDGAQQQLVALSVKQRLAEGLVRRDPDKAAQMLADLQADTAEALENLRDLARGIYPPLLADKGLPVALEGHARKVHLPVTVEADGLGRYPQEIEAAVYFCCLEALQNIVKYAEASHVAMNLSIEAGQLTFSVIDDGKGFDPASMPHGSGLQGMADRVEALGGILEVRSEPGTGTTVTGRIPTGAMEPIR
jgi:signal transduction histidine kinase